MRVAGLAFGGGAEQRRHVVLPFDVGLVCEIQVAAIGLRFAGEGVLQVLLGLRSFQSGHVTLLLGGVGDLGRAAAASRTLTKAARRANTKPQFGTWAKPMSGTGISADPSRRSARSCRRACGSARSCSTSRWLRPGHGLAHRHRGRAPLVSDQLVLAQELVALVDAGQRVQRAARTREECRAQPLHRGRRQLQVLLQERRVADRLEVVQTRDRQRHSAPAWAAGRRPRPSSGSSASSPPGDRRPSGRPRRCGWDRRCARPGCARPRPAHASSAARWSRWSPPGTARSWAPPPSRPTRRTRARGTNDRPCRASASSRHG